MTAALNITIDEIVGMPASGEPDWMSEQPLVAKMITGFGKFHTNDAELGNLKKKLTPYVPIDLAGIRNLVDNPQQVEKSLAQWLIPSTLESRKKTEQEAKGAFWLLWADIDQGDEQAKFFAGDERHKSIDQIQGALANEILDGADFELYASNSATEQRQKCRIMVPISKPLVGGDWSLCQEVFNAKLLAVGIVPDDANLSCNQVMYLPNRGEFYKTASERSGVCFDPMKEWAKEVTEARQVLTVKAAEVEKRKAEALERRKSLCYDANSSPIDAFNAAYSVEDILLQHGYDQRGDRFRHPNSETGGYSAGIDPKTGRVHSFSSADPLFTQGGGEGAHDAFSAFCVLKHGGDQIKAIKDAGDNLLFVDGGFSWNKAKQRKYKQEQERLRDSPPAEAAIQFGPNDDVGALFDDLVLRNEDIAKMADAEFLIPDMIVRGHMAAYVAPANGGKTTIFVHLCEKLSKMNLKVMYINVDGSPGDLKRHYAHAETHNYKVIAPDARDGKSTADVLAKLQAIAASSARCDEFVFIFDTLKKFIDVINKREAKGFYKLLRGLTVKGATVCLLGHCNKYVGVDGKTIFEGTGDLRNDMDELIYLDVFKNEISNTVEVTTRPDKVRAEFSPKSYVINLDDRSVSEPDSILKIFSKEEREVLDAIKEAIISGCRNQKEIVEFVIERAAFTDKRIRKALKKHSQGANPVIVVTAGEHARELNYSLPPADF